MSEGERRGAFSVWWVMDGLLLRGLRVLRAGVILSVLKALSPRRSQPHGGHRADLHADPHADRL